MNSLDRFIKAQELNYDIALKEVKAGRKTTHWMWYIFPQIIGLGKSDSAIFYSIKNKEEAEDYMNNKTLRNRIIEISNAVLNQPQENIIEVFGDIDAFKLKSSMTLFNIVSPEEEVFKKVLDKYYDGEEDKKTLEILGIDIKNENTIR